MRKLALLSAVLLTACADIPDKPDPTTHVAPGTLSWYLPKMTVKIDVPYTLTSCPVGTDTLPGVSIGMPVITPQPIPDLTSRHSVVVSDLIGWRTSNEVDVAIYDDGILKSLGANPQDQTAAIVGGVLKSAAQIAGLVGGAAITLQKSDTTVKYGCTPTVAKALNDVQTLRAKVLDPSINAADLASANAAITRLQALLSFTKTILIDSSLPPWDAKSDAPKEVSITAADMRQGAQWLASTPAPDDTTQATGDVLLLWQPGAPPPGDPVPADARYDYREPLVATLSLAPLNNPANVLLSRNIAFAQWGTPRSLPYSAPIFATLNWSYTFAEDGTATAMKVVTTARGVAASNLLNTATGAAGSAMTGVKSAAAGNSELSQLQNQDELIKAKTALINDTNALKTAGGSP
jgi:hypothetical protein